MADQINNKLQQFLIKEDYDGAIDMLKQAFENNSENYPVNLQILINMGAIYARTGSFNDAKEVYLQAHNLNSNNAQVNYLLGNIYYKLLDTSNAKTYLEEALKYKPDKKIMREIHLHLAIIYIEEKKWKTAESLSFSIIKDYPEDISALGLLGLIYKQTYRYEESEDYFNKVLQINPNHQTTLLRLCDLKLKQGKLDEGAELEIQAKGYYKF